MLKLFVFSAMLLSVAAPAAAQVDPQSLVGVWEGQWSFREQRGVKSGAITVTITKVESGKVHGKTEIAGSQEDRAATFVADATPTGYTYVAKDGNPVTATFDGGRINMVSGRGGRVTSVLDKKK